LDNEDLFQFLQIEEPLISFFVLFFLVLGLEPWALKLLGKCSPLTPQSFFVLFIFQIGAHVFAQAGCG
jgi:hypothetical protein